MQAEVIEQQIISLSRLIGLGQFDQALSGMKALQQSVDDVKSEGDIYYSSLANVASLLIDIGQMKPCIASTKAGLAILTDHKERMLDYLGEDNYFYNLSNAKTGLIEEPNPFKHSFSTIEQLVDIKTDLWKAIRFQRENDKDDIEPTFLVNLGNCLKRQFRLVEAIECYDQVIAMGFDIPQAWLNRSEALLMLHQVSNTYSIQMLMQIKNGYENVVVSQEVPPTWIGYYQSQVDLHAKKIEELCEEHGIGPDPHDELNTKKEYDALSEYRKFCLDSNLTLSEHGLYCACAGSARDNLTIPTYDGVVGDFVLPMELVLNRLKSEFSFARHLYYEYISFDESIDLLHESCFSELFNDELLGIDVERLRTAFRCCFGILDKIGVAICELYGLYPPNKTVSFQSFWQLDRNGRREQFDQVKNPGLLALYSIATDLNDRKEGEWHFLKKLRNDLEHDFVVVHKGNQPSDVYASSDLLNHIVFIKEGEFITYVEKLLQLTRSAIFSFVFAVRDKALKEKSDDGLYIPQPLFRQDFDFDDPDDGNSD
ncbi:MAG: LA2681 family HEPN domain-containing protein [Paraglaciecola sp.]|uniref:LA2681 family HEPN domain-containing protein n=1 Tax=Paraglaciecola sp. TaxID=1920173 RepID=UPI003267FB52